MTHEDFILYQPLLEWSKSDVIPEINRAKSKLAVFVFGSPASGKTTFIRSYLGSLRSNRAVSSSDTKSINSIVTASGTQFKLFNTDVVSALFTRDPSVYRRGTSSLVVQMIETFTNGGHNFIFDSTGNSIAIVDRLVTGCKEKGYTVLFVHMVASGEVARARNAERTRKVDSEYLASSLAQVPKISDTLVLMNPDKYYIVVTTNGGYEFYMREGDNFLGRNNVGRYSDVDFNPLKRGLE